jgi:hypothetical protein
LEKRENEDQKAAPAVGFTERKPRNCRDLWNSKYVRNYKAPPLVLITQRCQSLATLRRPHPTAGPARLLNSGVKIGQRALVSECEHQYTMRSPTR